MYSEINHQDVFLKVVLHILPFTGLIIPTIENTSVLQNGFFEIEVNSNSFQNFENFFQKNYDRVRFISKRYSIKSDIAADIF